MLAWVFARTLLFGWIRLTDDGVWPNRKGHPEFVAWEGALVATRGYSLFVKNGSDVVEISMASFCRQRSLREFINRTFPATSAATSSRLT